MNQSRLLKKKFATGQFQSLDSLRVIPDVLRGDHFFQLTDICLSDVPHVDTNQAKAMHGCQTEAIASSIVFVFVVFFLRGILKHC